MGFGSCFGKDKRKWPIFYALGSRSTEISTEELAVESFDAQYEKASEKEQKTLPRLLWNAIRELERAYVAAGAGERGMPTLDDWANLLRVVDAKGTDVRELPRLLRLSKRAVRTRVLAASRRGWIEERQDGGSEVTVRLTRSGSAIATRWKLLEAAAEKEWRAECGIELRAALEKIVAKFPLELPHYPASYGAADASITGGGGADWKAVVRGDGDTVSQLSVMGLLSQALVAFAMSYEEKSPVALSLSADIVLRVPAGGGAQQKSAHVSALVRHGFLRLSGDRIFLTEKGAAVRDAYAWRVAAVEDEWRGAFGDDVVTGLRRALLDVAGG